MNGHFHACWVFLLVVTLGVLIAQQRDEASAPDELESVEWGLGDGVSQQPVTGSASGGHLAMKVALARHDYAAASKFAKQNEALGEADAAKLQQFMRIHLIAGNMQAAQRLAARSELEGDALALQLNFTRLVAAQRYDEAISLLESMREVWKTEGGSLLTEPAKAWLLAGKAKQMGTAISKQQMQEIMAPIEALEKNVSLWRFALFQRGLLHDWLGNQKQADEIYQKLIDAKQLPYRNVQIVANFYQRHGNKEALKTLYQHYRKEHPDSLLIPPGLEEGESSAPQPVITGPVDAIGEIYFTLGSFIFNATGSLQTMQFIQLALFLRPDFPPAQMLLAAAYEQQEMHDEALAVYQTIDTHTPLYRHARVRIALNYYAAQRSEEAIELLQEILQEQPDNEEAVIALGDVYRRDKAFDDAAAAFERVQRRAPDAQRSWRFYYQYGICLERSGRWGEAEVMLKKALELEPEQPDVLNYLGYSWLEQGVQLEQAKAYIERAYKVAPSAAHIIDSMGWAYFLLGDYDEALHYLEQAADLAPQDPTLNEHLGDVYYRLGRRHEAVYQWQRALTFEAENVEVIEHKIEHGLDEPR